MLQHRVLLGHCGPAGPKRRGYDPKDCELCLWRVKLDESLVEARSNADVQIACHIWV